MPDYVEIRGLDELTKRLRSFEDMKKVIPALEAGAKNIEGVVKEYAPKSAANAPKKWQSKGNNTWYKRGAGPRWVRKDGSWGGRDTSELLGRQWSVKKENQGFTWIVGNNASYGEYVHGEKQAGFHKDRGWKTIFDVAEEQTETVLAFVKDRIDKILEGRI